MAYGGGNKKKVKKNSKGLGVANTKKQASKNKRAASKTTRKNQKALKKSGSSAKAHRATRFSG